MRISKSTFLGLTVILFFYGLLGHMGSSAAFDESNKPDSAFCLGCHGMDGFGMPDADGSMRDLHVSKDGFLKSVHAGRACVDCHKDITD